MLRTLVLALVLAGPVPVQKQVEPRLVTVVRVAIVKDGQEHALSLPADELALADDHNLNVVAVSSNYTCTGQEDVIALVSGNPTVTIQPAKKQKRKIILTAQGGSCTVQTPDRSFSAVVNTTSTLTLIPRPDGSGYWGL